MKKVVPFIIIVAFILTACGSAEQVVANDEAARIEIISSTGQILSATSYTQPSKEFANENPILITMDDGEIATVYFICEACGHVEEVIMVAPSREVISCACPKNGNGDGNTRKYVAVLLEPYG